nr:choice-of-anchor L domain-containing protein [uncultured Flavobacterium sp.]
MNRKIFFFFMLLSSLSNAQVFQENFDNGISNEWIISNNGIGTAIEWTEAPVSLGNNNTKAVMVINETANELNPIQDWLISPVIDLNGIANPELQFLGKNNTVVLNRNSVLKIMISTTGTNLTDFQLLETYTESFAGSTNPISSSINFSLKKIDLSNFLNQQIHIAFVMENTGVGKTWILDDVAVFDKCLDVTNIEISELTFTSGLVSWEHTGATSFEVELVTDDNLPTGIATHTSNTNSITLPLVFGTNYKVFIRAVCPTNSSEWIESEIFTPISLGSTCEVPLSITNLPYTHTDNTSLYGNDYSGLPGSSCGATKAYLNGDDVVYSFTPTEDMIINIELIPVEAYSGIFVYDDCDAIGVNCIAGAASTNATIRNINNLALTANTTYYFVISTWVGQSLNYTLNIQRVYCNQPISLTANNITQTSAELGWTNGLENNATEWQIFVQDVSENLPLTAGTTTSNNTLIINKLQNGNALLPGNSYEFYVRSLCEDGNYSVWSGPYSFNTLCNTLNLPFNESFNTNSTTEICWNVINANNDNRSWNLNYTQTPFEGDQCASFNASAYNGTNDDYLVTPTLNFDGAYRLRYKYKIGSNTPQNIAVKMSQNGGNLAADFTTILIADTAYNNTEYKEKTVYLPNFVGVGAISWHVQTNAASRIFIDDVIIEPIPTCTEPYDIINTQSTTNSTTVDWEQFGTVDSWDIVLIPSGETFTGDLTGLTVYNTTTKPYTIEGLPESLVYDVYIRSNCNENNQSEWSNSEVVLTTASNDECSSAISLTVNEGIDCEFSTNGSLIGATNSDLGTNCSGGATNNNDVWYAFTANATTHILNISNLQNTTNINSILYSGSCGDAFTAVQCNSFTTSNQNHYFNNLTIGETYFVNIYATYSEAPVTFKVCIRTPLQPILVTKDQYTVPELITDILINNPCANVANITWSTGESPTLGSMGIGYFQKNGSTFNYNDGIILSTGNVLAAPGPKGLTNQGSNTPNWGGDTDLQGLLTEQNLGGTLTNTTKLEFDFTAITNEMSFNFLFAAEEYGKFQCNYSDIFAFFLTDLTTGVTTYIAVVPNTNTPISVTTIHDGQYFTGSGENCGSANEMYFDNYYNGTDAASLEAPINFRGHTVSLVAQSAVVPGNTYHIKLAIADYSITNNADPAYDSAVFIEGGSFQLGSVNLGSDLTIEENNALCSNQNYNIESGLDSETYSVVWLKNGEVIPNETGVNLAVNEAGIYTIEATHIGTICPITDSILVELYPPFINDFSTPETLKICSNSDKKTDLTYNESIMLNGLSPLDFDFQYYRSLSDLENNVNEIIDSNNFTVDHSQEIFIKVTNLLTGCAELASFNVEYIVISNPTVPTDLTVCKTYQLPALLDDQKYYTGPNGTGEVLTENSYLGIGFHTIYVRSENGICNDEKHYNVEVISCEIQKGITPNNDNLNDYLDLNYFDVEKVQIFNRYGIEVYNYGKGYTNQWQGQDNEGKELPSGTYFYSIVTPSESLTGWIQLVREVN